jgi:hypothetical protein
MLLSFSFPSVTPLNTEKKKSQLAQDPNEIDIQDEDENENENEKNLHNVTASKDTNRLSGEDINCFFDYGIGSLFLHPMISSYFPEISQDTASEIFVTSNDVLALLASAARQDLRNATVDELQLYLCEEFYVFSLIEVGIILSSNLKLEMVMINHVYAARMRVLTEIQKKQLDELNRQERQLKESYQSDRKKTNSSIETGTGSNSNFKLTVEQQSDIRSITPKLNLPSRPNVALFLSQCTILLSDNPHSPSFSKVLESVEKVCKQNHYSNHSSNSKDQSVSKGNNKKGRKRKNTNETTFETDQLGSGLELGQKGESVMEEGISEDQFKVTQQLKEIAAEYIMLHLGGTKYRAKRFSIVNNSTDNDGGAVCQDDNNEAEASNEAILISSCNRNPEARSEAFCQQDSNDSTTNQKDSNLTTESVGDTVHDDTNHNVKENHDVMTSAINTSSAISVVAVTG